MKKFSLIVLIISLLLLLSSCTESVKAPDDSWEDIFLQYWNAMNNEYVHFSDDLSYDWDKIYDDYLPLFQKLDYTDKDDSIKAFKYFKEIAYGVHDNHYNLTVRDGFEQSLAFSPADLQKYVAEGKKKGEVRDIMDFPDLTLVGDEEVPYMTSVNHPDTSYDDAKRMEYYEKAIPSINEVPNLKDTSTGKKDFFHSPTGVISDEFGTTYCEASFTSFPDYYRSLLTDAEKTLALDWNVLFNELSLQSYFFGVNKDDIFYVYFSAFGNPVFLLDILTKDEKDLTEEEKSHLAVDKSMATLRDYAQKLIAALSDDTTITTAGFKKALEDNVNGLRNLPEMIEAMYSVALENKCEINGTEKTGIKGIIVDVRGNGGGELEFLQTFWGSLFPSKTQLGYSRYKAGYSRMEYTPWTTFGIDSDYVNSDLSAPYSKPVAILVNGYSVSCSEMSCIAVKQLPNHAVIGHTTYGGTCALYDRKISNSGPFNSAHLSIYTTTYQFVDNDRKSYETIGITPDFETMLDAYKDYAYSEAVEWVNGGGSATL